MKIQTFQTASMVIILVMAATINTTNALKADEWTKNGLTMLLLGSFVSVWLVSSILTGEIAARGCAIDKVKNPILFISILFAFFIFSSFLFYAGFLMLTGNN